MADYTAITAEVQDFSLRFMQNVPKGAGRRSRWAACPITESLARRGNIHALLRPDEDHCEAPAGGWRNRGSKLPTQHELRAQHNREGQT